MKIYILFLFLIIANYTFADEPRVECLFKSENQKFTLQCAENNKWLLKDEKREALYSITENNYSSMSIFISNDGNNIVVINDFVEGHRIAQKTALAFYYKGELKREYKLTDLIEDTTNVALSIWHTTWCLEDFGFEASDSVFSIATYEFNEIRFSTFTGEILQNKKPEPFDNNTLIVRGNFQIANGTKEPKMSVTKYIYGEKQVNDTIIFNTCHFGEGNWTNKILMIKNGIDVTPIRFRKYMF
ncbi:MAG: hypothetical protein LBV69_05040 [Bacteroidales bacterium]|jgi:hypothetical protein|nr:hypothetical protein [Bacteroidales bacterium]